MFFYSLSARFKPWYHSWPYVPESTTINPCLKIVIFYRTSPELLTFLVASNLKGRCSFPDHISKICFRYDNVCANIRGHNNCRRCLERYQQFSFQNELEIKFQMRLTHRSLNKNNQEDDRTMFSSLDGLRHSTSCAISSNVNRQPPSTFARNLKELRHSNPGVQLFRAEKRNEHA